MKKRNCKRVIAAMTAVLMVIGMLAGIRMEISSPYADQDDAGMFDPVYYAALYPDVATAVGTDSETLYNHYVMFGQAEGRIPYEGASGGETVNGILDATAVDTTEVPASTTGFTRASFPWFTRRHDDCVICDYMEGKLEVITYGATEAQVKERLIALKEVYPDGTYLGYGCAGFAGKLQTALYGPVSIHDPVKPTVKNKNVVKINSVATLDPSRIRTGDVIHTINPGSPIGHVCMVLDHDEWGVTVVEANWNGDQKAHWGRRISYTDLEEILDYVKHYLY